MIGELKPYSAYKDSGVPWLGEVPKHWNLTSLGSLTASISKRGRPDLPLLSVVREKGVILRSITSKEENHNFIPDDLSNYKVVQKGNLVINKMKAWQGSMGVSDFNGIVSPAYYVFDFQLENQKFGHALLRSQPYVSFFAQASDGVRIGQWDLSLIAMRRISVAVPPVEEQAAIAHFLAYADRRIRRYIHTKQKLIKLLEEQKQVVINEAVTRGIDPNASLKPSGIEWLGNIPDHWQNILLGQCLRKVEQGWSPVAAEGEITEEQWAVLTLSSVKKGSFNSAAIKPISKLAKIPQGIEVQKGDLLLTRSNARNLVGDVCVVDKVRPKTVLCDLIYRLQPKESKIDAQFLMCQLLSPIGRRQIEQDARGSNGTMPKISQKHIKAWRALIPSIAEQKKIVKNIDIKVSRINEATKDLHEEIALIREFRTRLIADVVTGKLDVREAAAKLFVETEASDLEELSEEDAELGSDPDLNDSVEDEAA
jgi:type I restriction enzyme, S subunit